MFWKTLTSPIPAMTSFPRENANWCVYWGNNCSLQNLGGISWYTSIIHSRNNIDLMTKRHLMRFLYEVHEHSVWPPILWYLFPMGKEWVSPPYRVITYDVCAEQLFLMDMKSHNMTSSGKKRYFGNLTSTFFKTFRTNVKRGLITDLKRRTPLHKFDHQPIYVIF